MYDAVGQFMQESLSILQERLKKNWRKAFAEVGTSVFGSIGIVFGISFVMQLDSKDETTWSVFASYFDGGELSLSILSLSGVIYLLMMRRKEAKEKEGKSAEQKDGQGFGSFLIFFGPVILAAVVVGSNPGFVPEKIGPERLWFLAILYIIVHGFWLYSLLSVPVPPVIQAPEDAAKEQEDRTRGIEGRAEGRVG